MRGKEKRQGDFISHSVYALIPRDHLFRRLRALLDWEALAAELDDCYQDAGRPSVSPEMMIRILFLQFLVDCSDRQIEDDLLMHNGYKLFAGLAPDERGIDHSTLSRFRDRVGPERFARLFNVLVEVARAAGVVADRLLSRKRIEDRIIRRRGGNGSSNAGRYVVERTNAIVKRWCGGGRARYWGIEKVSIQMTLASIAANLKRWLGMTAPAACPTG